MGMSVRALVPSVMDLTYVLLYCRAHMVPRRAQFTRIQVGVGNDIQQ